MGQSLDHFMESVRGAMDKPIQVEGESMVVSASMGMAIYPDDADDSIKLLRVADQRMYALKRRPEFSPKAVKSAVVDSTTIAIAVGSSRIDTDFSCEMVNADLRFRFS